MRELGKGKHADADAPAAAASATPGRQTLVEREGATATAHAPASAGASEPPTAPSVERAFGGDWAFGRAGAIQAKRDGAAVGLDRPVREAPTAPTSGGAPLPDAVRGKMERSLGDDFSNVRVHEGPEAGAIGAAAFAAGDHVSFAPGRYDPASEGGQALIGHELAHVVQQRDGRVGPGAAKRADGIADDSALEQEADRLGAAAARAPDAAPGASPPVQRRSASAVAVQRATVTTDESAAATVTDIVFGKRPSANVTAASGGKQGGQGDHVTAFMVFEDAVRNAVIGKPLRGALDAMATLTNSLVLLPGFAQMHPGRQNAVVQLIGTFEAAMVNRRELIAFQALQNGIDTFLELRNQVPGTAFASDAVKRGPAPKVKRARGEKRVDEHGLVQKMNPSSGQREKDAKQNFAALGTLQESKGGLRHKDIALLVETVDRTLDYVGQRKVKPTNDEIIAVTVRHAQSVFFAYPDLQGHTWEVGQSLAARLAARFVPEPRAASSASASSSSGGVDAKAKAAADAKRTALAEDLARAIFDGLPDFEHADERSDDDEHFMFDPDNDGPASGGDSKDSKDSKTSATATASTGASASSAPKPAPKKAAPPASATAASTAATSAAALAAAAPPTATKPAPKATASQPSQSQHGGSGSGSGSSSSAAAHTADDGDLDLSG